MSMSVSWKAGNTEILQRTVARALQFMSVHEGQVLTKGIVGLEFADTVLAHHLALPGVRQRDEARGLVHQALTKLPLQPQKDLPTLAALIEEELKQRTAQRSNEFRLLMPLNVRREHAAKRRSVTLLGTELRFTSWRQIRRGFDFEEWKRNIEIFAEWPQDLFSEHVPVMTKIRARDVDTALRVGSEAFEMLRSLLNLSVQFERVQIVSGGHVRPLGGILECPVGGVFDASGAYVNYFTSPHSYRGEGSVKRDAPSFERIRFLLKALRDAPDERSTTALLRDAVSGYGRALDSSAPWEAFLALWQVLERITFPGQERYAMDDVCRRAAVLVRGEPLLEDVLPALSAVRNDLVHAGKFHDWGDQDVRLLKMLVEFSIRGLLRIRMRLPKIADLMIYYDQSRVARGNPRDLEAKIRIGKLVLRSK